MFLDIKVMTVSIVELQAFWTEDVVSKIESLVVRSAVNQRGLAGLLVLQQR